MKSDFDLPSVKKDQATTLSSLNTLGYSPIPLQNYIDIMIDIYKRDDYCSQKPVIFSVTGLPEEVVKCYGLLRKEQIVDWPWFMEINLSCPNIPDKPPPAYSRSRLGEYLEVLSQPGILDNELPIGLKIPPYTYQGQFDTLIGGLQDVTADRGHCPVAFITATNTLGSCFVARDSGEPAINSASGTGIGAMAGAALHPLALGNVKTIRRMLDASSALKHIEIIGTGGVLDHAGYRRMREAGAAAVGVGTGLGLYGSDVFGMILDAGVNRSST
ncbi:MAG: hypothetical protein LQ340_006188 [Diploschistes diacapsis]|nr:MAG: hypothetical protein LQ340_006188 [Diploschistes diacapsis]